MRLLSRALAFAVLLAGATLPNPLRAQVVPAIKGGGSQINVYGLYALVKTDFNSALDYPPKNPPPPSFEDANGYNQGFSVGADFRLGRFVFGQPALGARFTYSTGKTGQTDNSIVYEFGGGVDYHKNRTLNFRMVDFQYQLWDLGNHYYPPGFIPGQPGVYVDTKLKPYTLSFGILVRVR